MRLRKNITRAAAFAAVGLLGIAGFVVINNNTAEDSVAINGSWANFVSTAWANESDARYKDYTDTPGSTESSPYLIMSAEEFSGIRAFENGSALAGKYLMLANDIDLSAHYWDPIEVYGAGSPMNDLQNYEYSDVLQLAGDGESVHIDGNSMVISGMNINNTYDRVISGMDPYDPYAGATGLFSYTYKANISNIRLEKPVMNLTETSGVPVYESDYYYDEVQVSDLMGAVVGAAQNSHIAGVHVNDLTLNYTAAFGEFVVGEQCASVSSYIMDISGCDIYYSPAQIAAGGAVGISFGNTLVSETSVRGGAVNVKPKVDETAAFEWMMDVLHYGGMVSVAGLVGVNLQSTVLSTCSSADVIFSDDDYTLLSYQDSYSLNADAADDTFVAANEEEIQELSALAAAYVVDEERPLDNYGMFFGGLVGYSTIWIESQAARCVYNSCSHSELNIDAEISMSTAVGGLVGAAIEDRLVNNYYDGNIMTSSGNMTGEILGAFAQRDYDTTAIRSNYYVSRGNPTIGMTMEDLTYSGFAAISTVDKLAADLNAGRAYVTAELMLNTALTSAQASQMTLEWAVQDGASALACTDLRTAGLVFPDNRIDVPSTGAL